MRDLAAEARVVLATIRGEQGPPVPAGFPADLASVIDHTLLRPDATDHDIRRHCEESRAHGFAAVCVNPVFIPLVVELLRGSAVRPGTVAAFPLGASSTRVKVYEVLDAAERGAVEVDVVANLGALKQGEYSRFAADLRGVSEAARSGGVLLKVILETALLTDEEKAIGALLAGEAGSEFVKTSTGFGPGGATVEDVRILRAAVGPAMGVKAAGGIRTYEGAVALLRAGATRIGTSHGVRIVEGAAVAVDPKERT